MTFRAAGFAFLSFVLIGTGACSKDAGDDSSPAPEVTPDPVTPPADVPADVPTGQKPTGGKPKGGKPAKPKDPQTPMDPEQPEDPNTPDSPEDPGPGPGPGPGPTLPVDQTFERSSLNLPIKDNDMAGVAQAFVVEDTRQLGELWVEVSVTHPYVADLKITLTHPDGTAVVLHDRTGAGAPANLSRRWGSGGFANAPLMALAAKPAAGEWKLIVSDLGTGDTGKLTDAKLYVRFATASFTALLAPAARPVATAPVATDETGYGTGTDLGYRYDALSNSCVNAQGVVGLNPTYVGECGDLKSRVLSDASYFGKSFRGADLTGAKFWGTSLAYVDLTGAKIGGADFREKDHSGAKFDATTGSRITFWDATMTSASFKGAKLDDASFMNARLSSMNFYKAEFTYAGFREASVTSSSFEYAKMNSANFFLGTVTGSRFDHADLQSADFLSVKGSGSSFAFANLAYTNFNTSSFPRTNFSKAVMTIASANTADFSSSDFRGADIQTVGGMNSSFPESQTKVSGSRYDDATKLPFTRQVASQRGMTYSP